MVKYTADDFSVSRLGSFYQKDKTVFRVFAPEYEKLYLIIAGNSYEMHRNGYVFEIALGSDLELVRYHYMTEKGLCFRDPFAYVSDGSDSIVLDKDRFISETITPEPVRDPIIYEASVRDFSSLNSYSGIIRSKFLSFTEKGLKNEDCSIGLDYLKEMGITHLQLMPVFDYDNDRTGYNWGYNPLAYNYVKKDYVLDQDDPYAYVNELRKTVNTLHESGIRVVLDVVFNHVYRPKDCDLEKMLPGHVFRYMPDGSLAAGTMCGNEVKTEDVFIREYICEMVFRYLRLFDIDGIRLDLMGIMDRHTVRRISETMSMYKKDFLVYGEGWNMGDILPERERATIANHRELPGVAMFNDYFRETMTNYICGNLSINRDVVKALAGSDEYLGYAQSINYVECHDGMTVYDRVMKYKTEDELWVRIRRCRLALALVMTARGIPFIHMGQEFLRSKKGVENSYNSGDEINGIDWDLRVENDDICRYFRDLVHIRKKYSGLTDRSVRIGFKEDRSCIIYRTGGLLVIINPTDREYLYDDGIGHEVLFDLKGACSHTEDIIRVSAYSLVICKE